VDDHSCTYTTPWVEQVRLSTLRYTRAKNLRFITLKRGNTLAIVRMPASISCQRAAISAINYRLKCLPVKGSATLVWNHVACNKKPGVKRRAYPSLLQAIDRGLRTEELDARFEPTRLTLPISPLDERQFRCVSDHAAFSSACRHQVILSGFLSSSSIFEIFFRHSSVENPAPVNISDPL
jgi:hypothetical protein